MVLTFKSVDETLGCVNMTIQMKVIQQYFHMGLFFMPCKVVPTFHSVDKTPVCDQMKLLKECFRAVLFYYVV